MQNFKNKSAFTMIELIFVIVILGILAAVAIPRVMATRDDASHVKFLSNVKICIHDISSEYVANKSNITTLHIESFTSCSRANNDIPSSIEVNSTSSIKVSNTGEQLDGIYSFSGTNPLKY